MKKKLSQKADKYELYEEAVQNVDFEVDFYQKMFKKYSSRKAKDLREDFCASAKISSKWVSECEDNSAYAIDLDEKILKYAKKISQDNLTINQMNRLSFIKANSINYSSPKVDIVSACNFSYWVFKKRDQLIKYFKNSHRCLKKDGLFILDAFGGYEAHQELEERTKYKNFTYVWDQDSFNPITNDLTCFIHFEFKDKSSINKAFRYDWRLWSLQEIKECLNEAGFKTVDIYMQGWDEKKDEETERFYKMKKCDADPGWLAYIIAKK
tara:strand:- start:17650 stop:18450 length:801 start_codon:yes stop_codon:yes gene_type:complete